MNTRIKVGGKIGGAATRVIQVSPQALASRVKKPIKSPGLTDREVGTTLVFITKSSTLKSQTIVFGWCGEV